MSETTRSHIHEIRLGADVETVFDALITPSAICTWWQAATAIVVAEEDGFFAAAWGDKDKPDYITLHRITECRRPEYIVFDDTRYVTKFEPPPFELDLKTRFEVESVSASESVLRVIQTGFPRVEAADEFYEACETGWKETFSGIEKYINSIE